MPMRQLRRCDFCSGDAAGVYEVLPPELDPTEAEQRRVVLCADCADTLETVVDPLLDRLGVDTGDADPDATSSRGASAPPTREPVDAGRDSGERSPAPATSGDAGGADAEPVQWGGSGTDDDGEGPGSDPPRDGVSGAEPSGDDDPTPTAAEADPSGSSADGGGVGDAAEGAEAADGDGANPAAGGAGSDGDEPAEFRTVMRLLGNREFPVERGSVVELAASAYDLDEGHVHRILDYAVDRGVIADDGGTLRRN